MEKIGRYLIIMFVMTAIALCAWNILNFLVFQWFGCRYYGFSYNSLALASPVGFFVVAPATLGFTNGAPVLGILGTLAVLAIVVVVCRYEAELHRQQYG